jgi:hypothetical protein
MKRSRDPDPEIYCTVPSPNIFFDIEDIPIAPSAQREAFNEISGKAFAFCFAAIKAKDPWRSIRMLVRAEKLVGEYVLGGFDRLLPLQEEFRSLLRDLIRVERRLVIRRALLCKEDERPQWKKALKAWDWGPDASADYWAVERALRRGADIFADLRRG